MIGAVRMISARTTFGCALCLWLALACLARSAAGDIKPEYLEATSSADHLWLLLRTTDSPPKYPLIHHARAMKEPWIRIQRTLENEPAAIAAWGSRVWIAFATDGQPHRQICTLLAMEAPAGGGYVTAPGNRKYV